MLSRLLAMAAKGKWSGNFVYTIVPIEYHIHFSRSLQGGQVSCIWLTVWPENLADYIWQIKSWRIGNLRSKSDVIPAVLTARPRGRGALGGLHAKHLCQ